MDSVRLSKLLAFILRHRPDSIGIELDAQGWTDLDKLVERLNASGRLGETIDRDAISRLVEGEGASRYAIEGARIRARSGHTSPSVAAGKAVPRTPPEFLYFGAPRERMPRCLSGRGLEGEPGRPLRLHEMERAARRAALAGRRGRVRIVVVEALRASRAGVVFLEGEPGTVLARAIPRRFLLSERPGFERQVSAGVVLVRRREEEIEIALIRTKPRPESGELAATPEVPESTEAVAAAPPGDTPAPPPTTDERREGERRTGDDRRRDDLGPPDGVERRSGVTRRRRRRRGWGTEGRMELPKGKIEPGETPFDAAVRELREETGLVTPIDLVRELPRVRYAFRTPEGKSVFKVVHYFLLMSRDPSPVFVPQGREGIVAVEWTGLAHALETIAFGNLRPVLETARDALAPGAKPPGPAEDSGRDDEPDDEGS